MTGAIAAGASTLCERLIERFGWGSLLEGQVNIDNPFFERAYAEPARWQLASQLHFLNASARRHQSLLEMLNRAGADEVVLEDRTPFEHSACYTAAYERLGRLPQDEVKLLQQTADAIERDYLVPDLVIYRDMNDEQLLGRVRERGRAGEGSVDLPLLRAIKESFDEMVEGWTLSPVVVVPADTDVKSDASFEQLAEEIRETIAR